MILSDKTLTEMIEKQDLVVKPLGENSIQPASIDCRLGNHFLVVEDRNMSTIDLSEEIIYREYEDEFITIPPHTFLLATTQEYVKLPDDITAFVVHLPSVGASLVEELQAAESQPAPPAA